MAQLPSVFRAQDHEAMDDFTPIPANEYISQIVKSEVKDTKNKDGKRLVMQEKILEGEYKGRIVFIGLNIINPNSTAVEIAHKELRSICDACGKAVVENSEELHMIPHKITVGIRPANANYPEQNVIKKYEALDGSAAAASDGDNPFGDEEG